MAGKRHSKADMTHIQGVHDSAMSLGADCSMGNVAWPIYSESLKEASLPMSQSHDALRGHLRTALMHAHGVQSTYDSNGPYVMDTFPGDVVYQHGGQMYQRTYKVNHTKTPPSVTLGEPSQVHRAYVPVGESAKEGYAVLHGATEADVIITPELLIRESVNWGEVEISESASALPTPTPVKLIAPGWGSTGYYSAEMLKRDGPRVFTKGLHMYMNHPTKAEEKARPEGDYSNLAAVLTEDAKWNDKGFDGPGLYSNFKAFSDHAQTIKEKGPHTGVSIRAFATKITEGEAEGRRGKIVEGLASAVSTDFVTRAGAGGKPLVESERTPEPQIEEGENNGMAMTEQESTALREAQTKVTAAEAATAAALAESSKLRAEANQAIATAAYIEVFKSKGLELSVEAAKVMAANPPLKDGKVDVDAIKKVAEGLKAVGKPGAKVINMGGGSASEEALDEADKANLAALEASLREGGLAEAAAKIAVAGRV